MVSDVYKILRFDVRNRIKKEKLYGRDCAELSDQIYNETHRQVSCTTLKRFFGLIRSEFKPSKYTLDSLSQFVGFKDWHDYLNCYDDSKYTFGDHDSWDLLKIRLMQVTEHCLKSLKQKTGYNHKKFIFRSFVEERLQKFQQSEARGTMFIAPDGYGKSTLMIQIAEKILKDSQSEVNNDIVILIDGGIFFNLYSNNNNIELLNQLLDFKIQSSLSLYFQQNPQKLKGRIWMLIDSIDEIFFDRERYQHLIENLMRIIMAHNNNWFKVIVTCRPENLEIFTFSLQNNPLLETFWYNVGFFEEKCFDAINIPPFKINEIKSILKLHHTENDYKEIFSHHKDVLEIISHPYSLSLFIGAFSEHENVSEIILLNRYINTNVLSPPFLEEKLVLINKFIELCNYGKETYAVKKNLLLPYNSNIPAYRQLISNGVLYEYVVPKDTVEPSFYVNFNKRIIFMYFVLRAWSNNRAYSSDLFFKIMRFYNNNEQMQCNLLKMFIKMLLHNKNFELIKTIHISFEKSLLCEKEYSNIPECLRSINSVIQNALDRDKDWKKILQNKSYSC